MVGGHLAPVALEEDLVGRVEGGLQVAGGEAALGDLAALVVPQRRRQPQLHLRRAGGPADRDAVGLGQVRRRQPPQQLRTRHQGDLLVAVGNRQVVGAGRQREDRGLRPGRGGQREGQPPPTGGHGLDRGRGHADRGGRQPAAGQLVRADPLDGHVQPEVRVDAQPVDPAPRPAGDDLDQPSRGTAPPGEVLCGRRDGARARIARPGHAVALPVLGAELQAEGATVVGQGQPEGEVAGTVDRQWALPDRLPVDEEDPGRSAAESPQRLDRTGQRPVRVGLEPDGPEPVGPHLEHEAVRLVEDRHQARRVGGVDRGRRRHPVPGAEPGQRVQGALPLDAVDPDPEAELPAARGGQLRRGDGEGEAGVVVPLVRVVGRHGGLRPHGVLHRQREHPVLVQLLQPDLDLGHRLGQVDPADVRPALQVQGAVRRPPDPAQGGHQARLVHAQLVDARAAGRGGDRTGAPPPPGRHAPAVAGRMPCSRTCSASRSTSSHSPAAISAVISLRSARACCRTSGPDSARNSAAASCSARR